jgi:ATP-dependent Clp protease ATP-binding subunit ClpX
LTTRDLQAYGLIPEFLGRLPVISTLHPLSIPDLVRILIEPKNALVKQYQAIFEGYGCELRFTRKALDAVAAEGYKRGGGARGLRGVLEEVLAEAMFEVPSSSVRYCLITGRVVKGEDPAGYFSRGQKIGFLDAFEREEGFRAEADVEEAEEEGEEDGGKMRAVG